MWARYREGLKRLKARDRRLIVGRAELGYNYQHLAAILQLGPCQVVLRKLADLLEQP